MIMDSKNRSSPSRGFSHAHKSCKQNPRSWMKSLTIMRFFLIRRDCEFLLREGSGVCHCISLFWYSVNKNTRFVLMWATNKLFLSFNDHLDDNKKITAKQKPSLCECFWRLLNGQSWKGFVWEEVCRQKTRELEMPLFQALEKMSLKRDLAVQLSVL